MRRVPAAAASAAFLLAVLGALLPLVPETAPAHGATTAAATGAGQRIVRLDALPVIRPDFPVPTDKNVVFYIQRSSNPNTVVYRARFQAPGVLDRKRPLEVYWRRFNTTGERRALTSMERLFAFGLEWSPVPGRDNAYLAYVRSYPQRKAIVETGADGTARAVIAMGGHSVALKFAYVQLAGGGWLPDIIHIDIFGVDTETGEVWRERITPDEAAADPETIPGQAVDPGH